MAVGDDRRDRRPAAAARRRAVVSAQGARQRTGEHRCGEARGHQAREGRRRHAGEGVEVVSVTAHSRSASDQARTTRRARGHAVRSRPCNCPRSAFAGPVFATVLSLVIVLIGLISYTRLSVREYPRIDEPVVSVNTTYRGASAEVVESQVTKPLEDSLAGIEGVELMTSQSRSERSQINVRFKLSRGSGFCRGRRARQGRARARPAARRDRRAGDREGRIRLAADHLHRGARGIAVAARGVRLHHALHQAAHVGAAGRRRRAHLRRAPGFDADQSRPHAARRLPADRAGRRGRDPPPERRDSRRPHRVAGARVHRRRRDRPHHRRAVRPASSSRTSAATRCASATWAPPPWAPIDERTRSRATTASRR